MSKLNQTMYAIYKTSFGGLQAREYINTLDKCKDLPGAWYIEEKDLPIIVNRVGGRTSFYPDDENFVEIITVNEDKEPLTREQRYPKNSPKFLYGWIDTEGNTYVCGYEGHSWAADAICEELKIKSYNGERSLENLGWLKITKDINKRESRYVHSEALLITKKQADTLFDLGLYECESARRLAKYSHDKW
jgi:hypothetical protein